MTSTAYMWTPIALLPNLSLADAIEGGPIALAPTFDARVENLRTAHAAFDTFLGRFTDAFRQPLTPATLIARDDILANGQLSTDAVSGFRDLVAASVVPLGNANNLRHARNRHTIGYSDFFALYPWTVDQKFDGLVARTPAILGIHDANEFYGQGDPGLFVDRLSSSEIDLPLLNALASSWAREFVDRQNVPRDRSLFRSLNMANDAMRMAGGPETTYYDVGRSMALLVSAFEILAHDGKSSDLTKVLAMIQGAPWLSAKSTATTHASALKKIPGPLDIGRAIYTHLYVARNDFLHGNPVAATRLQTPKGKSLWQTACVLYRMLLASELALQMPASGASLSPEELAAHVSLTMDFQAPQLACERALAESF